MQARLIAALIYGATGVLSALGVSGIPHDQAGWVALIGVFITAFWGKFSSSQTLLAPNRPEWSDEQRAANAAPKP